MSFLLPPLSCPDLALVGSRSLGVRVGGDTSFMLLVPTSFLWPVVSSSPLMNLLCHLVLFSHVFIFFLYPLSIFPLYPSYVYSQADPPMLTVCFQSQALFNTTSVISPNSYIIESLNARTTPSLLAGTMEWANNPSQFHPGCRFEVLELFREEFSVKIGGESTFFSFASGEISTDDVDVH